ncbi:MAG: hypothetical protein ACLPSF_10855 [Methylocella sp.]
MKTLSALTLAVFVVASPAFARGVGVGHMTGSHTAAARADRAPAREFSKLDRDAGARAPIVLARAF